MSAYCMGQAGANVLHSCTVGHSLCVCGRDGAGLTVAAWGAPVSLVMCCASCSVLQTLVIKVCGVILSVVGGLAVGKVMCIKLSVVLLACCYLLLACLPQLSTSPVVTSWFYSLPVWCVA